MQNFKRTSNVVSSGIYEKFFELKICHESCIQQRCLVHICYKTVPYITEGFKSGYDIIPVIDPQYTDFPFTQRMT